mgnify:CR=1 FL=1
MLISRRNLLKGLFAGAATAVVPRPAAARDAKEPLPDAVGMLYDSTLCIGCKACVVSCREVNGLPPTTDTFLGATYDAPNDLSGSTKNVIKLGRDGDKGGFFKNQCMHCVDPACVSACMVGALHKAEHGIVANKPFAVYRLGLTPGDDTSLLTVRVLADKHGKCGEAQLVHALNVMCGFEEMLGTTLG